MERDCIHKFQNKKVMKEVIESPFCDGTAHLKSELSTVEYRKEQYSYTRYYYVCDGTGIEFTDNDADRASIEQVYSQYREKYGIPAPERLIDWRKSYGLSAVMMSRLLGLGENQYGLYEKGEMPALSIGRLLSIVGNMSFIIYCVNNSPLTEKEKSKALKSIRRFSGRKEAESSSLAFVV